MQNLEEHLRKKFNIIAPYLDEKRLRIWAATEALLLPRGKVMLL